KQKLHVFNLLSYDSIETKIATGLLLKQNLFEGVLNSSNLTDEVDFSEKGKSQFIKQLEEVIKEDDLTSGIENESILENQENGELLEMVEEFDLENRNTNEIEEQNVPTETFSGKATEKPKPDFIEMEAVMTKGMEFLTGIYKMSTGHDLGTKDKPKVLVNKETRSEEHTSELQSS